MKKRFFSALTAPLLFFCAAKIFAQTSGGDSEKISQALFISPADLRIENDDGSNPALNGGYHLYIRKKSGLNSVLLAESTKDPAGEEPNYAYRATAYNPINGDETRILNGTILDEPFARWSLVDSTPEPHPEFGEAFHIYIPEDLIYGYNWTRHGAVKIQKGTFINIRAFSKPYADYSGDFADNPYVVNFEIRRRAPIPKTTAEPVAETLPEPEPEPEPEPAEEEPKEEPKEEAVLTDDYNPAAGAAFSEISQTLTYSKGEATIVDDVIKSIEAISPKGKADVVFAIDATGSMKDDIQKLREDLVPQLLKTLEQFSDLRLGLLLYRDYTDSWRYRGLPIKFFDFTRDKEIFLKNLNAFTITGNEGGDIPEAVYEALYGSMEYFDWSADAVKKIILIGDAEPHPRPRGSGKYTKDLISQMSQERGIQIDAIITPDEKSKRGR